MPKSKPAKSTAKPKSASATKATKPASKGSGATAAKARKAAAAKPVKPVKAAAKKPKEAKPGKLNGRKAGPVAAPSVSRLPSSGDGVNAQRPPPPTPLSEAKMTPFLRKQKERLVQLRDNMLDSMSGVAKDTLRSRAEGSEASAFGMHQADAGSDAYDRDFALSLLSQEQDALYEIEEAIKRIDLGSYGVCEMSGKPIAHARLEAIPFARYTVECQSQLEKQNKVSRSRVPVTSLFGLTDGEDGGEAEEEEAAPDAKE